MLFTFRGVLGFGGGVDLPADLFPRGVFHGDLEPVARGGDVAVVPLAEMERAHALCVRRRWWSWGRTRRRPALAH